MAEDARDAESAWRDLIASYSMPGPAADAAAPWPEREGLAGADGDYSGVPGEEAAGDGGVLPEAAGPAQAASDPVPGVIPSPPRIIRPASPAPLPPAGEPEPPRPADDDEHFVPPVPPPLPRLDPVSKGAWLALFGGPGYLLLAVMMGWQIPGVAAFCAVAAFVGGFATLVVRMQDRPPGDSGPDDGAVV